MTETEQTKLEYRKPALIRIDLATDEVLAVSCKTAGGNSNAQAGARPCRISPCSQTGS